MRKYLLIIVGLLYLCLPVSAQHPTYDDQKEKQWKSMENGPWDFSPAWYYLEKPLYFDPFGQIEFAPVGHNIIAPCKVLVQGSILFYPFRDSGFS